MSKFLKDLGQLHVYTQQHAENCKQFALGYKDLACSEYGLAEIIPLAHWQEQGLAHEAQADAYKAKADEIQAEIELLQYLQQRYSPVMNELLAACDFSALPKHNELLEHLRFLYGYYDPDNLPGYDP
jgi:hypothetical protein